MRVIATRQMHGVYGTRLKDEEFEVDAHLGKELLKGGLVRQASDFRYEVKAIQPTSAEPIIEAPAANHQNKRK